MMHEHQTIKENRRRFNYKVFMWWIKKWSEMTTNKEIGAFHESQEARFLSSLFLTQTMTKLR